MPSADNDFDRARNQRETAKSQSPAGAYLIEDDQLGGDGRQHGFDPGHLRQERERALGRAQDLPDELDDTVLAQIRFRMESLPA